MELTANILGISAVILAVFSYQLKRRGNIIIFNAASRVLYVVQYILLGAFEGALLDVVAFIVSIVCYKSNNGFIKKHFRIAFVLTNLFIISAGMITYKDVFSLLPILGVMFETMAFWLKKERNIRIVSLLGVPPWLIYNILNHAYGTSVGNVITFVSIAVAIVRYDILKKEKKALEQ